MERVKVSRHNVMRFTMKGIAFLLLACFLLWMVSGCKPTPTPTPVPPPPETDVQFIREYACELANHINEFYSRVGRFEGEENRTLAAGICRDMEVDYRRLRAESYPPELKDARDHVLGEIRKFLNGAWDWAAIEEKDEWFKRKLEEDISSDVKEIETDAAELVRFIDELYSFVRAFEDRPRSEAPSLCEGMELRYHALQAAGFASRIEGAKKYVLKGVRDYLEKAWDWAVSEEGDEVKRQFKKDVFDWEAVPSAECRVTPTPTPVP